MAEVSSYHREQMLSMAKQIQDSIELLLREQFYVDAYILTSAVANLAQQMNVHAARHGQVEVNPR